MAKGYVIQVGGHVPQKVIVSKPDRDGNPLPNHLEKYQTVGAYFLINRSRAWARRVLTDGKPAKNAAGSEEVLEVTDTRYRGTLEFLKWGENKVGAQAMEIRYLSRSLSLDYEYQKNVQKIEVDAEGKDASGVFELVPGENKFDTEKEALKVLYLQVHHQNRDSKSKNPDPSIKGYTFFEISDDMVDRSTIEHAEAQLDAGIFVKNLSNKPAALKNLLELFTDATITFGAVNDLSNDTDIYKALLKFAAESPTDFNFYINGYKKQISDNFSKARIYQALDLTKNGFIVLTIDNKKEILFDAAEGKGDGMIDWVMQSFLEPDVWGKTKQLKTLCDKLK